MTNDLQKAALQYHASFPAGKVGIVSTKPTDTQYDLSLCYTPGVAEPVKEIAQNDKAAYFYTNKNNLVAVISNGTAVLGLGNVGPLASKPVMEGKAVLFKRFAGIDVYDLEIACDDPLLLAETIGRLAPTFGGINLEDIKAPECFMVEQILKQTLTIPVFHDDQHGTAIVIAAGLLNALELQHKTLDDVQIVCAGAGAAGIAAMNLLVKLGAQRDHILMVDRIGVIHTDRKDLNRYKQEVAIKTAKHTLVDALDGADVFIGVSGPGLMTVDMLKSMATRPILFALSNPTPEIMPEVVRSVRDDVIMATGRSDYPNQVNNALCFPYIFRGALDVYASCINEAMQMAAVYAIKELAKEPVPPAVLEAYGIKKAMTFGPDYLLPLLIDPRLKTHVSSAVANAAITSGVAQVDSFRDSQVNF